MKRFFGHPSTQWDDISDLLHIYHVIRPDTPLSSVMSDLDSHLSSLTCLGVQPRAYYHATITQLPLPLSRLSQEHKESLITDLDRVARDHRPWTLTFRPPIVKDYAVETIADHTDQWQCLLDDIRAVCARHCGFLPPPPFGAHATLRYGISEGENEQIRNALGSSDPVEHVMDDFALVTVAQHRDWGGFTFEVIERFSLTSGSHKVVESTSRD